MNAEGARLDLARTGLELPEAAVAELSPTQRRARVVALIGLAHDIIGMAAHRYGSDREIVARMVGFSGGNDSTVLLHLMRHRATAALHVDTTIGIPQTEAFVAATAAQVGVPLRVYSPDPQDSFAELVLERGFPGPAQHYKMFQRLKERAIRKCRRETVEQPRRQRMMLLAGRRRTESSRRALVPEMERDGSVIWVSPLVLWTSFDMNTYREMHDVPTNPASGVLHMSGECLCGSFAKKGELEEIAYWYPDTAEVIRDLERRIADRDDIRPERRRWGWGAYRDDLPTLMARARSGPFCSSCSVRFDTEGS